MLNGYLTRRTAVVLPALFAVTLGLVAVVFLITSTPAAAQSNSPPATPSSVSITRADGTVTASWPAVSGATKYHATYTTDNGGSWHAPVDNHTNISTNSVTFSGDNAKTYIVGVRAGNDHGWSGWRNSPSSGPYTPPAPGPVASVTLTRADGTLNVSWPAVSGATKYHVTYTVNGSGNWLLAALNHTESSIDIGGVDNAKTYVVGVRAGNDGGWSGWRNSPAVGPYQPDPTPTPAPTPTPTPDPAAGIIVQDSAGNAITTLAIPEGGEASYQVKLASQPAQDVEVCIGLSVRDYNDADITFKGEASDVVAIKLPFTPQNWNTPQTVTLVAAEDNDYADGARDLDHDTRTSDYFAGTVWLAATEIDNDEPPPAAPTGLTATAGDQSVTLAWNDPADSSITGYEYRTRWAGVAWGEWTAISAANSHTVTGLDNGTEYRFKLRAVNAGGASKPGPQSAPWYVAATPQVPPPPAPTGLTVTPGNGYLDIAWDAVSGATGYDVRAKTAGAADWHDVAGNVTATSHRYTTDATIDYVAVRARNADGAGPWAELSRAPAHDWRDTLISSGASGQSVQAQAQLGAPTWGTITRTNGRVGQVHKLHLNWTTVTGATGYNLACTDRGTDSSPSSGWEWHTCGWVKDDGTVSYDSVPSAQARPVTVTHYRRDSSSDNGAGDFAMVDRSYDVRIRAVNNTPADASNWTYETNTIHPVDGKLTGFSATRGNGSITLTWTPNAFTTAYDVDCAVAVAGQTPAYTRCATLTGQDDTASSHTVTISQSASSYTVDNTKTYLIKIVSKNTWGLARMLAPPVRPATLRASSVSQTGATLTLSGYSPSSWYLKRTTPADTNCKSKSAATETLSTLTSGTSYTYKAYSDSGCANELASVTFTPSASVSNLSATSDGTGVTVYAGRSVATGFTTGSNGAGYTLHGVTVKFKAVGATVADTLTVAVHAAYAGNPAASATYTLSGVRPTGAGEYAYTCSGTCALDADTTYFLVLSGGHSDDRRNYTWDTTASASETNTPGSFGWAIADKAKVKTGASWSDPTETYTGIFKVNATAKPVSVSNLGETSHSFDIVGRSDGARRAKAVGFSTGSNSNGYTLQSVTLKAGDPIGSPTSLTVAIYGSSGNNPAASATHTLSGDAPDSAGEYTYTCSGGCGLNASTTYFLVLSASTPSTGDNYYRIQETNSDNETNTPSNAGWAIANVSKYSNNGGDWTNNHFSTALKVKVTATAKPQVLLTASGIKATRATLTIANHDGNWWLKKTAPVDSSAACKSKGTTATEELSALTEGTSYTYKAYSDSSCANELASVTFTPSASVSNLSAASDNAGVTVYGGRSAAIGFTTGSNSADYTLHGVTVKFLHVGATADDDLTVAIHAASGGNPAASATYTLSGDDPTSPGEYTYTCSACTLSASTTYFLVLSGDNSNSRRSYTWDTTASGSETNTPSNFGWSIADTAKEKTGGSWRDGSGYTGIFRVGATAKPVSVGNLTETGTGNLTIGRHTSNTYVEKWATAFTTGSNTGGYTVQNVIAKFGAKNGSPGNITAKIYADSSGVPGTAVANLTLTGPTAPSSEDATYVCSGTGCSLSASTMYHLSFEVAGSPAAGVNYQWRAVTSDNETNVPSGAGWSIANGSSQWKSDTSSWTANANVYSALFEVTATTD